VEEKIARWSGMITESGKITAGEPEIFEENSQKNIIKKPAPAAQYVPRPSQYSAPAKVVAPVKSTLPKNAPVVSAVPQEEKKSEEKKMYEAICNTCEEKILVPFTPDPKKPVFCKECLKDYQRLRERERAHQQKTENPQNNSNISAPNNVRKQDVQESPIPMNGMKSGSSLHLSQLDFVSPKRFKPNHRKPQINFQAVRDLISKAKKE
jgi:CxxC-x17-CxxC domain-containing protein